MNWQNRQGHVLWESRWVCSAPGDGKEAWQTSHTAGVVVVVEVVAVEEGGSEDWPGPDVAGGGVVAVGGAWTSRRRLGGDL